MSPNSVPPSFRMPEALIALVVDDDPVTRLLLSSVLNAAGIGVKSFDSAAELLDEGSLETAGVLLLDLRMPGMSGLELHQLLLQRDVVLPVLFISGEADLATAVTAMRNGAADFIEKPFQGPLLIESVRRAVARHAERVADGQPLPFKQSDLKIHGWAMESRLYAEDPYRNFLPSIGRLTRYRPPVEGKTERGGIVRNDTGVYEGGEISMYYDPMIAKLCTWAPTRARAIDAMAGAQDAVEVEVA